MLLLLPSEESQDHLHRPAVPLSHRRCCHLTIDQYSLCTFIHRGRNHDPRQEPPAYKSLIDRSPYSGLLAHWPISSPLLLWASWASMALVSSISINLAPPVFVHLTFASRQLGSSSQSTLSSSNCSAWSSSEFFTCMRKICHLKFLRANQRESVVKLHFIKDLVWICRSFWEIHFANHFIIFLITFFNWKDQPISAHALTWTAAQAWTDPTDMILTTVFA